MKKKKTIIYGGAFNPPTLAHQAILKSCAKQAQKINADLWILPSGDRYDKQIPVDRRTRVKYLRALISDSGLGSNNVHICRIELNRKKTSRTIDTVNELERLYPNRSFIWVFGADSAQNMTLWKSGKWMLENLEIIFIKRYGYVREQLAKNATWVDAKTPHICSTDVRNAIQKRETVEGLVGPSVKLIIENQNTSP